MMVSQARRPAGLRRRAQA